MVVVMSALIAAALALTGGYFLGLAHGCTSQRR